MEVRERILSAAAALYGETGFRGATTRRIAERAGVNEVTLFRHFGSKTLLLREAIKCAGAADRVCVLPDTPGDVRSELVEWALLNYQELFARRSLIRTAMGEIEERPELLAPEESPAVCAGLALRDYLDRLKRAGRILASVDAGAATTMFMGALFSDAISRDVLQQMYSNPPDVSVRHYVDLFIRAIGLEERAA
jgi:AcrR family transcriptional regulator